MPAADACSGMCGPPQEACWHPPASQGSWESRHRMGRSSVRLPCPLPCNGIAKRQLPVIGAGISF